MTIKGRERQEVPIQSAGGPVVVPAE